MKKGTFAVKNCLCCIEVNDKRNLLPCSLYHFRQSWVSENSAVTIWRVCSLVLRSLSTAAAVSPQIGWHPRLEFMLNWKRFISRCKNKQCDSWCRVGNFFFFFSKNSPKQKSRLQAVELDDAVNSILSLALSPPEEADTRAVAAWGQQTSVESLVRVGGVGSICSFGAFHPHNPSVSCMRYPFPPPEWGLTVQTRCISPLFTTACSCATRSTRSLLQRPYACSQTALKTWSGGAGGRWGLSCGKPTHAEKCSCWRRTVNSSPARRYVAHLCVPSS